MVVHLLLLKGSMSGPILIKDLRIHGVITLKYQVPWLDASSQVVWCVLTNQKCIISKKSSYYSILKLFFRFLSTHLQMHFCKTKTYAFLKWGVVVGRLKREPGQDDFFIFLNICSHLICLRLKGDFFILQQNVRERRLWRRHAGDEGQAGQDQHGVDGQRKCAPAKG